MIRKLPFVLPMLAGLAACMLPAPAAAQPRLVYLRSTCFKVNPGAGPEFEKLQSETILKLAQYRIKQGAVLRYGLSRAVLPGGEQSECDYLMSFTYPGFPPELDPANTTKYLKAAGSAMDVAGYLAKTNSLAKTVATRIFLVRASAGAIGAGSYFHVNRIKVKDQQAWLKLETELWKPVQEARVADGQLTAWVSYSLILPGGTAQPFNAATVDAFPTWDAQLTQKPLSGYVAKAHPNMTMTQFNDAGTAARDLLLREVFKVVLEAH